MQGFRYKQQQHINDLCIPPIHRLPGACFTQRIETQRRTGQRGPGNRTGQVTQSSRVESFSVFHILYSNLRVRALNTQSGARPRGADLTGLHGGLLADSTVTSQETRSRDKRELYNKRLSPLIGEPCTRGETHKGGRVSHPRRGQPSMTVASAQRSECTAAALMLAQKRLLAWALQ